MAGCNKFYNKGVIEWVWPYLNKVLSADKLTVGCVIFQLSRIQYGFRRNSFYKITHISMVRLPVKAVVRDHKETDVGEGQRVIWGS